MSLADSKPFVAFRNKTFEEENVQVWTFNSRHDRMRAVEKLKRMDHVEVLGIGSTVHKGD